MNFLTEHFQLRCSIEFLWAKSFAFLSLEILQLGRPLPFVILPI